MIWLTLRQFRTQGLTVLGALLVVAVALASTRTAVGSLADQTGAAFQAAFLNHAAYRLLSYLAVAAGFVLPAVIGVFWGAPLVAREVSSGTHRLVWSQSVTRTRWLVSKLMVMAIAVVTAGMIGLAAAWWFVPVDASVNSAGAGADLAFGIPRLDGSVFGARGFVVIAFALAALMIGVTVGTFVRRAIPAMAVTLVAVVGLQVAMPVLVQSRLMTASESTTEVTRDNLAAFVYSGPLEEVGTPEIVEVAVQIDSPGAWMIANETVDADGDVVGTLSAPVSRTCFDAGDDNGAPAQACFDAIAEAGYRQHVVYHPADHYWSMQWRESVVLIVLAVLLAVASFWRVRRDLS